MNRQGKVIDGKVVGGIEWTKTHLANGEERQGYTWNPVKGCKHGCRWKMPDGSIAKCYAEEVAEGVARHAYPHGFNHHYFSEKELQAPLKLKKPAKIFMDSMSDLLGNWVPDEQIEQVLEVCRQAHWHTFQLLTKNAPRLLKFNFPENVWVGASVPPTFMNGKELSQEQQERMLEKTLQVLQQVDVPVRWISFEPLSWDCSELVAKYPGAIQWAVIGAASNGRKTYQPKDEWVDNLFQVLNMQGAAVFPKGNLKYQPFKENFPKPLKLTELTSEQFEAVKIVVAEEYFPLNVALGNLVKFQSDKNWLPVIIMNGDRSRVELSKNGIRVFGIGSIPVAAKEAIRLAKLIEKSQKHWKKKVIRMPVQMELEAVS